jgi:hypothetical protein
MARTLTTAAGAADPAVSEDSSASLVLTSDEKRALIRLLERTLDDDRYPLAPRLDPFKAILVKLVPPELAPASLRPLLLGGTVTRRGRRR